MRVAKFIALIGAIAISACAIAENYGDTLDASHRLSLVALIGDASWYDGEPVTTIGVSRFSFEFESSSKLYATESDYEHDTYSYVVLEVPPSLEAKADELMRLNGGYIEVSGIFHFYERVRLPTPSENQGNALVVSVCQGICGAVGYIEVIGLVTWR